MISKLHVEVAIIFCITTIVLFFIHMPIERVIFGGIIVSLFVYVEQTRKKQDTRNYVIVDGKKVYEGKKNDS